MRGAGAHLGMSGRGAASSSVIDMGAWSLGTSRSGSVRELETCPSIATGLYLKHGLDSVW